MKFTPAQPIPDDAVAIALFGASPDTANMGVSALYRSFLHALGSRIPAMHAVVFDNGLDERNEAFAVDGRQMPVIRIGARGGRRYHRPENLHTMALLSRLASGARFNRGLALLDRCQAVMDVAGGDSFSDIYGPTRFRNVLLPKIIAARRGRPLLLLPQTYGPFREARHRAQARVAVLAAGQAWSRDLHSHEVLKDLLGEAFDPRIHRTGVDMAFGLVPEPPPVAVQEQLADWLDSATPCVGLNISGMIWGKAADSATAFGFKADYRQLLRRFVSWMLETSDVNLLMVPHVFAPDGDSPTDSAAAAELLASLGPEAVARVRLVPAVKDERQLKWIIARTDWFCGTRMHATIAGLSSGIPTATISYSDKARGVFETCGQGSQLVDPRQLSTEECLTRLQEIFLQREQARQSLAPALAQVKLRLAEQMDEIARFALQQGASASS